MASVHEKFSERFYKWELRGRGWQVFSEPVYPEPPFEVFAGHYLPNTQAIDDGRRPSYLGSLFGISKPTQPVIPQDEEEPEAQTLIRDSLIEIQTSLPANLNIPKEAFEQFFLNLSLCREPIVFELLGVTNRVVAQFAANATDAPIVSRQLQAYFPDVIFQQRQGTLENAWDIYRGAL